MLDLTDKRWELMKGGYGIPFDPRALLAKLESGQDTGAVWDALWENLHHQGDVGEASYAAVPHLVRIHGQRGIPDWNTYGLVSTIELARETSAPMPAWLTAGYQTALQELVALGLADLASEADPGTVRAILAVVAIVKGARIYGRLLAEFSEEEVAELQRQAFGEAS